MSKCTVCGSILEKPVREVDLGDWSLSIIRDYDCCERRFREYVRKTKESLNKGFDKRKSVKRYMSVNSEPVAQGDDAEEWNNEDSFSSEGDW